MTRRRGLIGVIAAAAVALVVLVVLVGEEAAPKRSTPGRAVAVATGAGGRSFALLERQSNGRRSLAVGEVRGDGSIDLHDTDAAVGEPAALVAERDGTLLVLGTRSNRGVREPALARVRPDGGVAQTLHPVGNGRADTIARAVAVPPGAPPVVVADTTEGDRHAIAVERTRGAVSTVDLVPNATAGAAATEPDGDVLVAGTDSRDGDLVRVRVPQRGELEVVRAPTELHGVTWRAITVSPEAGAAAAGDGRLDDGRSVLVTQRLDKGTKAELIAAAGPGDAYAAAVQFDRQGRLVIGANGTDGDRQAAFVVTFSTDGKPRGGRRPRAPGRVAGLTPDGGLVTTHWDGERQVVTFIPR